MGRVKYSGVAYDAGLGGRLYRWHNTAVTRGNSHPDHWSRSACRFNGEALVRGINHPPRHLHLGRHLVGG